MAERITARAKRHDAPKQATRGGRKTAAGKAVQGAASGSAPTELGSSALADENQQLKADLAAARQRIADLESKQTDITNRIAWVIDSLHNLND